MSLLTDRNTGRPNHAFFGVSRFTYPARNGTFLYLVGLHKRALDKVVLLGSGPIEPFEISALPPFRYAFITAIDSDPTVYELVREGVFTDQLDMNNLAKVCRSTDAANDYLADFGRISRQIEQVRHQGWRADVRAEHDTTTIIINQQLEHRLKAMLCNVQNHLPKDVAQADLIFEGFMLVNWAKDANADLLTEAFLKRLATTMSPQAWFASATSVTHYLGYAGRKPFFRQALAAGLLPAAGVMMRWAPGGNGTVTSHFGSVLCAATTIESPLFKLGEAFENDTLHWISTFGIRPQLVFVDLIGLAKLLEKGDVLSFRAISQREFRVVCASWSKLSRQCQLRGRAYELDLDYKR